jgi:feruloyl esterase
MIGLGVCAQAQAQSAEDVIVLTESVCTSANFAATISPDRIGEPVSAVVLDSVAWQAAGGNSPAHCLVNGQLQPVDRSDTARPIRFGVALPAEWNRRAIQKGGGGMNGSVPGLGGGDL